MLKGAIEKGDLSLFKFIASRDKKRGKSLVACLFFSYDFLRFACGAFPGINSN
jgi:hypothetical protein